MALLDDYASLSAWFQASAAAACADVTSASVTGTVRDASNAVIPGATVEIVNAETNQRQQTVTDARGRFRLLYLAVGPYQLSVQLSGFGSAHTTFTLKVGDQVDVPIVMQAAARDGSRAGRGGCADRRSTAHRRSPRRSRRRRSTRCRSTGATTSTWPCSRRTCRGRTCARPIDSRKHPRSPGTGVSVAGQRNLANSFIVDGMSANDDAADLAGTFFSEEVIREFQVVTSGGVAEFGRASSGIVSIVTKSGTNQLSGRAYEFFRDDAFDARNPLSTRRDGSTNAPLKDPLRQNQFGAEPRRSDRAAIARSGSAASSGRSSIEPAS